MNFLKGSLFRRNTEPEEPEPMEESGGGILAVWGSPGCGKTVTAVKIAKHLAAQKKNTVLLLCDMTAPMMPCICPPSELAVDRSLGSIFAAQHISVNLIKHNLTTLKRLPHLTMLGLRKKENEYTYAPCTKQQAEELIRGLREIVPYLKKPLKQLVDNIVDALAELPEVSECYEVWNQIHEELNECYGHNTPWERLPLSQRKEFRKIKNDIIREAENIRLGLPTFEDERMQDEPEPESQKEEHQSYSVYEQAQRYRAAKAVLQDIYALDAEHTEAVKALEQLWEEGYTVAAHQLGKFYRDDLSTLRDYEKAEQWFRCSAEAGNDFSEYALGKLLLTQKRTVEALGWLGKAAEQGNQFARYRLGKFYLTGEAVPKDVEKALAYLTASADQGNQFAQYTLGKLYLLGRDVPPDHKQAREWLIRAAAQGNEYACFFLDRFDQFRDPSVMLAATKLLHHMSRIFQSNSVPPGNPAGIRIDSKRRRRLMEKRMAMGHKADDHEEQTQYQQSM